jgi:hypothetical protein
MADRKIFEEAKPNRLTKGMCKHNNQSKGTFLQLVILLEPVKPWHRKTGQYSTVVFSNDDIILPVQVVIQSSAHGHNHHHRLKTSTSSLSTRAWY